MNLKPIIIETKRLILKGISPQDMTFIFENHSKEKIMKFLGHNTEEEYRIEELKQKNGYATYNRSFMFFLLIEKASNNIIGRAGFHNWNFEHRRAEIGYHIINNNFKQMGFMTEAVGSLIEYGFNKLKLHRIEALVGSYNIPSLKIMNKYNFVKEGLLRQHYFTPEKYEDSIMFSILSIEYMNNLNDNTI